MKADFLAAMAGVDPQLYEAARVDGAGRFRRIWHITLPGIRQERIGLKNVHDRLLLTYKTGKGLVIRSDKNIGTLVVEGYLQVLERMVIIISIRILM